MADLIVEENMGSEYIKHQFLLYTTEKKQLIGINSCLGKRIYHPLVGWGIPRSDNCQPQPLSILGHVLCLLSLQLLGRGNLPQ